MPKKNGQPYNHEMQCDLCEKPVFAKMLCKGHYASARYRMQFEEPGASGPQTLVAAQGCARGDCDRMAVGGCLLCANHYQQARRWKMTNEQYAEAWRTAACANCGSGEGRMHMDHDHSHCKAGCGECFRAILCLGCNIALGYLKEDAARIRGLANYIERF